MNANQRRKWRRAKDRFLAAAAKAAAAGIELREFCESEEVTRLLKHYPRLLRPIRASAFLHKIDEVNTG